MNDFLSWLLNFRIILFSLKNRDYDKISFNEIKVLANLKKLNLFLLRNIINNSILKLNKLTTILCVKYIYYLVK